MIGVLIEVILSLRCVRRDALRFAALLAEFPHEIPPEAIQSGYQKPGAKGITIFTPKRIQNARHMADMVNTYRSRYDGANQYVSVGISALAIAAARPYSPGRRFRPIRTGRVLP